MEQPEPGDLSTVDSEHATAFKQGLARLLSTEVAETTYSEILDGLPTIDSFREFHFRQKEHPVDVLDHASRCPGVVKKTQKFREGSDPSQLTISSTVSPAVTAKLDPRPALTCLQLLSAFRQTHPNTRQFELRLIELLAVSCHQIAVYLFKLDEGVHKHALYEEW